MVYSEGINAVTISPDINAVDSKVFYQAVKDLIKMTVRYLERNADFFFIKEFKEAVDDLDSLVLREEDVNLSNMQFEYLLYRKESLKIDNSEVIEDVLRALIRVLNRGIPEAQATKMVSAAVKNLTKKYDFLQYVEIAENPGNDGLHAIRVFHDINNVWKAKMALAIERLISEVAKLSEWKDDKLFVELLKTELGGEQFEKITALGVNLDHIKITWLREGYEALTKKALEALIEIVGPITSESFAVVVLDTVIKDLEREHDVLKYIQIDKSRYMEGAKAISINPDINNVEPYKLGKALREVIRMTYRNLEGKSYDFIEEFKHKLGEKYLSEIENLGVNLHFLELEFR